MKVLFAASNSDERRTLELANEITQLQQRLSSILPTLTPLEFKVLPHIEPEQLFSELQDRPPDILHLSAHAARDGLEWSTSGESLWITANGLNELLGALLVKPRLVYLNACESRMIASVLTRSTVDFAVGTEIPLMNKHAILSAVKFYDWLAHGHSIQGAFDAAQAVLNLVECKVGTISLESRVGTDPRLTRLRALPMIVARFPRPQTGRNAGRIMLNRKKDGCFNIEFGVLNCPRDTVQVVFFTVAAWFIRDSDKTSLEDDLSTIEREHPWPAELWIDEQWDADVDYRVYATGVRASGEAFTISSSPSEALTVGLEANANGKISPKERSKIVKIVAELRQRSPR